MKLHDIGNTVAQGVKSIARMGATFLTVHAYPQTMHAAVDARAGSKLRILAVTVLTSYDDADLAAAGYDFTVPELVAERAAQARDVGVDGLVCSAAEAANAPRHRRRRHGAGDARHPAGGRRRRRPEAHHDAGGGDQGRRRLSRGRPAGGRGAGSEGGGGRDRRGDRGGEPAGGDAMPKGYWIAHIDVQRRGGLQALCRWPIRDLQEIRRRASSVRAGKFECPEGASRARNVRDRIPGLRRRARLLPLAGISGQHRCGNRTRVVELVIIEGYDGPQP